MPCSPSRCTGSCWTAEAAANPPTALLAFVPNGDPTCDRRRVMLCHTETSPAVADTALPEITRIVNAVGRPSYNSNQPRALTNACFHCDTSITGDELADQVRHDELDGLLDLGRTDVADTWLRAAIDGASNFLNHGHTLRPSVVPKILVTMLDPKENPR